MVYSLGTLRCFLKLAENKPSGKKKDDQGAEESSAPEFILFVQGWLKNFPKTTVGNWQSQVQKSGNTLTNFLFSLYIQPCCWHQNKQKIEFTLFITIFNRKASNFSPVMPSYFYLFYLQSALVSTTGVSAKIEQNNSLFGATEPTPDSDVEDTQWKILISSLYSLKDPGPSIACDPY